MFRTPIRCAMRPVLIAHTALAFFLLFPAASMACAQASTPAPPQEPKPDAAIPPPAITATPGTAYEDAMRPVEITHRAISNWSPIEQESLSLAMSQAAKMCPQFDISQQSTRELLQLSRLCSLAENWSAMLSATDRYLKIATDDKHTSEVLAMQVDARLHLRDEQGALKTTQQLIARGIYDRFVAIASDEMIDNVKFVHHAEALDVAHARQDLILKALAALQNATSTADAEDDDAAQKDAPTLPALYSAGVMLAELQEAAGDEDAAKATVEALNDALPDAMGPADLVAVTAEQQRFALLGKPLPQLHMGPLQNNPSTSEPAFPVAGAETVVLLFPQWCAQCARLASNAPQLGFSVEGHVAEVFIMVAKDPSYSEMDRGVSTDLLKKHPFYNVDAADLDTFVARDYPLMVVTDTAGIVRVLHVADEQALQPGSTMDSAVALVGSAYSVAAAPKSQMAQ